jgi:hypothetical protein
VTPSDAVVREREGLLVEEKEEGKGKVEWRGGKAGRLLGSTAIVFCSQCTFA